MAKIKNPKTFSKEFGIPPSKLAKMGFLDPVLNVDTALFIDPLLLEVSSHADLRKGGVASLKKRFDDIIKLLRASKSIDDVAWKAAYRLFDFPEITATCIGYGAASIRGHSWGPHIRGQVLRVAKEIIDLGVVDPDLFMLVSLLEDGIGPDLISDMATNIVLSDLVRLNEAAMKSLGVPTQAFRLPNGQIANLPRNPLVSDPPTPVILVPTDVLKKLPIATSWSDVGNAASQNSELRLRVNRLVGSIWQASVRKKEKGKIRARAYAKKEAFEALLDAIHAVPKTPYDINSDPAGELAWRKVLEVIAQDFPLVLNLKTSPSIEDVHEVVGKIVQQFQQLIEDKGLWKELWSGRNHRPEKAVQRLFFAVADTYCKANQLDITPEADTGTGVVDFKISAGYDKRVLVEVKLSTNPNVVAGYEVQLATYKKSEGTDRGYYVLIDVGGMGKKDVKLLAVKNAAAKKGDPTSEIVIVDGKKQKSASKRGKP